MFRHCFISIYQKSVGNCFPPLDGKMAIVFGPRLEKQKSAALDILGLQEFSLDTLPNGVKNRPSKNDTSRQANGALIFSYDAERCGK